MRFVKSVITVLGVALVVAMVTSCSEPVDKDQLERVLESARSAENSEAYTEESVDKVRALIEPSEEIFDDPGVTQEEVDDASDKLFSAIAELKFRESLYAEPEPESEPEPELTQVSETEPVSTPVRTPVTLSYESVPYDDIARKPDSYIGRRLKFSGYVLQVVESSSEVDVRMAVDDNFNDVLLVAYKPDLVDFRLLEGDEIIVTGKFNGLFDYTSTAGEPYSIPSLLANSVELNN